MDLIGVLSSFNKISIIAFFVTLAFIVYELYLFRKENIRKKKPTIPDFKGNNISQSTKLPDTVVVKENISKIRKPTKIPIYAGLFLLVLFGLISILGLFRPSAPKTGVQTTESFQIVSSKGIKVFNPDWSEISDKEMVQLEQGKDIIIGIETIKGTDIDKARIRINKDQWGQGDIVTSFDYDRSLFFETYKIGSSESSLTIEAQLHSKRDGWLGE